MKHKRQVEGDVSYVISNYCSFYIIAFSKKEAYISNVSLFFCIVITILKK